MDKWGKSMVCIIIFLSFISTILNAQVIESEQDSVRVIQPEKQGKKKERLNFRSFFRDKTMESTPNIIGYRKLTQVPYENYEGKIIREIKVLTLDPFDYSLEGESEESINFLLKTGNCLHIKSKKNTIRNSLLFRESQPFDSLSVKESERLIRSLPYTREVAIVIQPILEQSDSVDVWVYELDRWSIVPRYSSSELRAEIGLRETNLLGLGHGFTGLYNRYKTDGDDNFSAYYFIPNILSTYIHSTLMLGTDIFKNKTRSIALERPFFSPLAQWAGGVNFTQVLRDNPAYAIDSLFELRTFNMNTQDIWAGWSFRMHKKGHKNERITRFISNVRFLNIRYSGKSIEPYDSLGIHANEQLYMATIGITKRAFRRDKFIFDYGITEDVPIGSLISFTGGYQSKNNQNRLYLGSRISYGNYFEMGYFSSSIEFGSFFNQSKPEQSAISFDMNYFSGLITISTWKFRQFVKMETTIGVNRFAYEKLSFDEFYPPSSYNNFTLLGNNNMYFTFQSQFYAPYKFLGFRFAPFFIYSIGMIGQQENMIFDNRFYSQIGAGILINNLNLVFNAFQVSIAFYPIMPNHSSRVFALNPFRTSNIGFSDFQIGKPSIIKFE
ncbi:MAG: hypothetical protein ACK4K0_00225 [Flavobacteriales bacterium]